MSIARRLAGRRSGRAALWLALTAVVGLTLVVWFVFPESKTHPASPVTTPTVPAPARELVTEPSPGPTFDPRRENPAPLDETTRQAPTTAERVARFNGVGRVRGRLTTDPPNLPLPEHWTLVLEPSSSLHSAERAERRELACGPDGAFVFENVPLGGYDLVVDAGDLDCRRRALLLAKPESQDVYVVLVAHLSGELLGRVVDAYGLGAEGVAVALTRKEDTRVLETATGPGGEYRFERVHDGEWSLAVGLATNPLFPARDVSFAGPRVTAPDFELPPCGEVAVFVHDERGSPLAGVAVSGYGAKGGAPRTTTDLEGRAVLRWLPEGLFTVLAERATLRSKQHVTVLPGETIVTRFVFTP
ncbi:MAG: carboxypeptidase-like regulatory domain-containing protein [Planctomycetes bacterium]|nr:carboxypeptidase-like regulatory domain-containing protein [Planctomycetota bacterium]